MVGRTLSPMLQRQLENLDKDEDSRKSAMRALKSYVKNMDFKTIPTFLAQVSETKETGSLSGEFTISLYEVLARVHGVKIVPMIDSIMQSIVQTLASSAGSFPLQQACSKVVPAIARYGIDPTTPEDRKRLIIHSLFKPLSDSLSSSQECLSSGAALCLEALVDSDNWRFASAEMVNKVCQNVAVALEVKSTQTNSHMGLVMALAKRNPLIVEAYARLLIQSGLRILNADAELSEGNSQKRFAAIQMMNFLMKCLDPRSIFSEVELVIDEMEKCQSDQMAYVKDAAFEALRTAKKVAIDKKSRSLTSPTSVTGSNFSRRDYMGGGSFSGDVDLSPQSISPESQNLDFLPRYESVLESPISTDQPLMSSNYEQRSVNRKLWSQENGGVDVSLKDGMFSEAGQLSNHSVDHEPSNGDRGVAEEFSGFMHRNQLNRVSRSTTSSPLRSHTQVSVDSIQIFETPRRLIHSLQDLDVVNSDCSEKRNRRTRSRLSGSIDWSPVSSSRYDQTGFADHVNYDDGEDNESLYADVPFENASESVSSTDGLSGAAVDMQIPPKVVPENRLLKTRRKLVCGLSFVLVAMVTPLFWINNQEEAHYLVPT
ncbi:hypothetical protein TanjilG_06069 [Lupinus angustifolius]|uniref:TORTIFOLIA1/SINE1-2 N-terminal domain-containing protein n=1 Tax=Lupinus angustifolius TaxID=3871 RepID=A0A4P1RJD1_LUPAN|nr:PREDICTED: uncharacterized protein LOC109347469 [Lupinus angustifolius]OIW12280.1 hypothetical protein TanjilG_06069 [Lupinus angustifolius]